MRFRHQASRIQYLAPWPLSPQPPVSSDLGGNRTADVACHAAHLESPNAHDF
jgi:hypothetical protein